MSYFTPIDLSHGERKTSSYDRSRDMLVALAWNAVKKTLEEHDKSSLFKSIKSIKITEKYIVIATYKPIVHEELLVLAPFILARFHASSPICSERKRKIRVL